MSFKIKNKLCVSSGFLKRGSQWCKGNYSGTCW